MAYSLKDAVKDALKLNLQILPVEASDARFKICQACPFYNEKGNKKCSKCGCYMPVKTKLTKASCPVRKW